MDAMELFTFRRTQKYDPEAGIDEGVALGVGLGGNKKQPNRGVDGPSQQRFLFYMEAMLYQGIQAFHFLFFLAFFFLGIQAQIRKVSMHRLYRVNVLGD